MQIINLNLECRILLVGGGSGGHVYPLVAVAESLKKVGSDAGLDIKLMMLGGSFIDRAAQEAGLPFKIIKTGKIRRYKSFDNFFDIGRLFIGFLQSLWHIFLFMPDAIFVKGGAASIAPALVSKLYFIPLYVHESDSIPGLANRMIGKISKKTFLAFKLAEKHFPDVKTIITGNPIRRKILNGDIDEAKKYFNLNNDRPTIFVIGGSQGAKMINDTILSGLVSLTERFNIIHQCGDSQYNSVKAGVDVILKEGTEQYSGPIQGHYRYYSFLNEMELSLAYALADVIVSRAGAGAIFEIAAIGKPAIIVPIAQSAANHQYFNAFEFSLHGAFLMEESNLSSNSLNNELGLLLQEEKYKDICKRIRQFAILDSADKIGQEILEKWIGKPTDII